MPVTFLGIYDCPVPVHQGSSDSHSFDIYDNRLGGYPIFPLNTEAVHQDRFICSGCNERLYFLMQIYAPLSEDEGDRFVYIFCCNKNACSSSWEKGWKVLRISLPSAKHQPQDQQQIKCGKEAGISFKDLDLMLASKLTTKETVSCTVEALRQFHLKDYPRQYSSHFFYTQQERKQKPSEAVPQEYKEKISAEHDPVLDNCFEAFSAAEQLSEETKEYYRIIAQNPSQVLRYSIDQEPLKCSAAGVEPAVKCCSKCGAALRFEFQLIPSVISILQCESLEVEEAEKDFTKSLAMDWEGLYVFTCSADCEGLCEEVVVIK